MLFRSEVVGRGAAAIYSGDLAADSLGRYVDGRTGDAISRAVARGSLVEGHMNAVLALSRLGSSLDVGVYDFNSVQLLAELAHRSAPTTLTTDPSQFHAGRGASAAVNAMLGRLGLVNPLGTGYSDANLAYAEHWRLSMHDHFKIVVAGLDTNDITQIGRAHV